MDPQQILDSVFTTSGAAVVAAFVGVILGTAQSLIPGIPSAGQLQNVLVGAVVLAIVGAASLTSGQHPSVPNAIGFILAFSAIYAASLTLHAGTQKAIDASGSSD